MSRFECGFLFVLLTRTLCILAFSIVTLFPCLPIIAQQAHWKELNVQIEELYQQGKFTEALPIANEAFRVARATFGPESSNTVLSLNNLGEVYKALGRYGDAEPLLKQALDIRRKTLGPDDPVLATSLNNLATLYEYQGRYALAEPLYKQALAIRRSVLPKDHPDVATSLNNLAGLYVHQGRYEDAESLFIQALAIWEKSGESDLATATVLNNLAELYFLSDRYGEAEALYQRALGIRQRLLGPEHPAVATLQNNLAGLYEHQGRYSEAEPLYKQAMTTREKTLGREDPDVAESLNNLAALYYAEGRFGEAEPLYKQAVEILEKALGLQHPQVASLLNNLANLYEDQGAYAEAESLFKKALAIDQKVLPKDHPGLATDFNNLAALYEDRGRFAEAERLLKNALAIRQKVLGPDHVDTGSSLLNLGVLYQAWGHPRDAQIFFNPGLENLSRQFEKQFTYMNERERLGFLKTVSGVFPNYFSFVSAYYKQNHELAGRVYDLLLWEKGMVGHSVSTERARLTISGDASTLDLFNQLAAKRNQFAAMAGAESPNRDIWRNDLNRLQREADDIEGQLIQRSATFADSKRLARPSWRDVQKSLAKDEAAVELVRFDVHDGRKWTGKTKYVALVLTAASGNGPVLIDLGDAATLTQTLQTAYYQRIAPPSGTSFQRTDCAAPDRTSQPVQVTATAGDPLAFYRSFWKPLEAALGGAKRIYISTDGAINQVALGLIPTPNGHLLMETDLRLLNRTADLLQSEVKQSEESVVLFANPDFNLAEANYRKSLADLGNVASDSRTKPVSAPKNIDMTLGGCRQLPQVRVLEVGVINEIAPLLQAHGWTAKTYVEEQALVEVVEHVQAPRVLHIATHGDFLPDLGAKKDGGPVEAKDAPISLFSDPMLRSRLFFAGANRTLDGHPLPGDLSDGILTAYQASTLNLHGTELVVLSACETGRGDVEDGEGVFGLRRALQEAGAESVLMALWEVPARETQELLNNFYRHWLDDGIDKHQALLAAQEDEREIVKQRYGSDLPYYWGAFVLVGRD